MARAPRLLVPEVLQTSAMDCGPAALKALLDGFGLPVSYGRLREICQTDVDGTSIDMLETLAIQLGLDAEQVMLPREHLLLPSTEALPALAVVRLADGALHFVVLWRTWGSRVQIMDPSLGRRWVPRTELLDQLYVHAMPVAAEAFRAWAGTEEFLGGLRRALSALAGEDWARRRIDEALEDSTWKGLACLDAAARLARTLVEGGALPAGETAAAFVEPLLHEVRAALEEGRAEALIPSTYWTAVGVPGDGEITLRGVVCLRARGTRGAREEGVPPLSPELEAASREPPTRPLRELVTLLRRDGVLTPAVLLTLGATAAVGGFLEALLLRGVIDAGRSLTTPEQRLAGVVTLLALLGGLLLLELPLSRGALHLGRRLELRLRLAFLGKLPRLGDRYFRSRLVSDMAQRCHGLHMVRSVPSLGVLLLRAGAELTVTLAGLIWLTPRGTPLILLMGGCAIAVPLLAQRSLLETDRRVRDFDGVLSRFYLDALRGSVALRAHHAERTLRRAHDEPLRAYLSAARALLRRGIGVDLVASLVSTGGAVALVLHAIAGGVPPGALLLLLYWALGVTTLGRQIAEGLRQYPAASSLTGRLVEPLRAPEEGSFPVTPAPSDRTAAPARGVAFTLRQVEVKAAGHTLLRDVDLSVQPGEQVAIVGPSGAGKSSLVGLLLGWHRAAGGHLEVDGEPLEGAHLWRLRRETAWVEPEVALWNRPLVDNLSYGGAPERLLPRVGRVLHEADLLGLLDTLPQGLQTPLGEGGALLSGGEGQRVRLGRALLRPGVRLVILDEPFRGLERERRAALLERARRSFQGATLLCVLHDISETLSFDRVLVVQGGRVVEQGAPRQLAASEDSPYRALLEEEAAVRRSLARREGWRRLSLERGRLSERPGVEAPDRGR